MFKNIKNMIFIGLFANLMIFTHVLFAEEEQDKYQLVSEIIEISGFNEQFSTFDGVMQDTLNSMLATNSELNTDEKEHLKTIVLRDLNQIAIVDSIKQSVIQNTSVHDLNNIIDLYKSEILQKARSAARNASKPDVQEDFIKFATNIDKQPPSVYRLKQIKKLDETLNTSKFQARLMGKLLETILTSFNRLDHKLNKEQLNKTVENVNMFMQEAAKEQVKRLFLYTFKDFSDQDLDIFINIQKNNQSLLTLNNNIYNGLDKFFSSYSVNFGSELADFVSEHKKAVV